MSSEKTALHQSSMATMRKCPRQYHYSHVLGLRKNSERDYFRFGTIWHSAMEMHDMPLEDVVAMIDTHYPDGSGYDMEIERNTVVALLTGHRWIYRTSNLRIVAPEVAFDIPLINPETGAASRTFTVAGRIDAIGKMDGKNVVVEYKTSGDAIESDDYWMRLRYDAQVSTYVHAAQAMGIDTNTVIYDVTRKPTIAPRQIPLLDDSGCKIVLDSDGNRAYNKNGTPRQSASSADGMIMQCRPETPEEFGVRLLEDITSRPPFYYQRREVIRLEDDITGYMLETWQQAKAIIDATAGGRWFRNVGKFTCSGCDYSGLCLSGVALGENEIPSGYTKKEGYYE